MIDPQTLPSDNFEEFYPKLETGFIDELETLALNRLYRERIFTLPGAENEKVEFVSKSNYKIRIKRPNKNLWSVPLQDFRKCIKIALREGTIDPSIPFGEENAPPPEEELPLMSLLHVLPEEEYLRRSLVGNLIEHQTLGDGKIIRILESGNLEIEFKDQTLVLKPSFVKLKGAAKKAPAIKSD
ncbi:MAG: hypothetical protein Kow0037_26830 [Calditrichia bacterium]